MENGSFRILVNDDSAEFGQLFCASAARLGLECVTSHNLSSFVEAVRSHEFDLVCMQMVHPEVDGLAALQVMAGAGYSGTVMMFNHSTELYSRVADHLSAAFGFDLKNYRWPLSEKELENILNQVRSS